MIINFIFIFSLNIGMFVFYKCKIDFYVQLKKSDILDFNLVHRFVLANTAVSYK